MTIEVTTNMANRAASEWSKIAKEPVQIKATTISEPIYAFGSELACLRLFAKMRTGRVGFSENMVTWFYCNK